MSSALCTVCTESMARTAGAARSASARMRSSAVSARSERPGATAPTRRARIATWATDSSPLAYSTAAPARSAMPCSICDKSVDLPIPGSPPSRTSDPGTTPPPSTRSSSPSPVVSRPVTGSSSASATATGAARAAPPAAAPWPRTGPRAATSSTRLFHSPQPAQRPCQRPSSCPHAWQRNVVLAARAISAAYLGPLTLRLPAPEGAPARKRPGK